jgi:hypothetical protein
MNCTIMIMQVVGFDEVGGEFFKEMLLFGTLQPMVSSRLGEQVQYNDRSLTVEGCRDGPYSKSSESRVVSTHTGEQIPSKKSSLTILRVLTPASALKTRHFRFIIWMLVIFVYK